MKLIDIVNQKYETGQGKEIIRKALLMIPPLSKYSEEEIPIEALEKAISIMCKKYQARINSISPDIMASEKRIIWRGTIIHDNDLKTISVFYGVSIYEVFAKATIIIYSLVKGGLEKREDNN